jgi:hypothetical protein
MHNNRFLGGIRRSPGFGLIPPFVYPRIYPMASLGVPTALRPPPAAMAPVPRSQGEMGAMFLRHEGFLGAVGAFLKVHPMTPPAGSKEAKNTVQPHKVINHRLSHVCMVPQSR